MHTPVTTRGLSGEGRCGPCEWDGHGGAEPVDAWIAYARRAATILQVAAKLRAGSMPDEKEWRVLLPAKTSSPPRRATRIARPLLVRCVDEWIIDGDVRPYMIPGPRGDLRLKIATPWWLGSPSWPLFGAIGVLLAQAITRADMVSCSGCGKFYSPPRRPRTSQRSYCAVCRRKGIPLRDADRDRRARERARS
jgi:hypothetical protein